MRPVEDIEHELALVKGELGVATAERAALAKHVDCLRAPVTSDEARAFSSRLTSMTVRLALDEFLANRQRRGQFAAFGPAVGDP